MTIFTERVNSIDGFITIPIALKKQFKIDKYVRFDYTNHYVTIEAIKTPSFINKEEDSIDLKLDKLNRIKIPEHILKELEWDIPGFPLLYTCTDKYIVVKNNMQEVSEELDIYISSDFISLIDLNEEINMYVKIFDNYIILSRDEDKCKITLNKESSARYVLKLTDEIIKHTNLKIGDKICIEKYMDEIIIRKI